MKRNILWSEALHDITLLFNRSVADQYDEYHQPTDGKEHLLTHFRNEHARWQTCVGNTIENTEAEEIQEINFCLWLFYLNLAAFFFIETHHPQQG